MIAALHARGLLQADDWAYVAVLARLIDGTVVVSLVESARLGVEPEALQLVEQRRDGRGFVRLARLDLPRERQIGLGADSHVEAISVEAAALARRDGGAVAPGSIRVAVLLAFRPVLVLVALAVRVCGHVGGVDGDIPAEERVVFLQLFDDASGAAFEQVHVVAELRREAVARPFRGHLSVRRDHGRKITMLAHERHRPRPRRDRVHGLRERHPDHGRERIARSARPAGRLKLVYEPGDLG